MRIRVIILALSLILSTTISSAEEPTPRIAIAYDIGFKGDGGFNDAVGAALAIAKKRFNLVPPFIREVPTTGTAIDRLYKLRNLARSGYTLVIAVGSGYREAVRRVSMDFPEVQFAIVNDSKLAQLNISNISFDEFGAAKIAGTIAGVRSRTRIVAIIGGTQLVNEAFIKAAGDVQVLQVSFSGDLVKLRQEIAIADVIYSLWDQDARVYESVISRPTPSLYIARNPDQYFANLQTNPRVIAVIEKKLDRPINQLVRLALQNRALIDVLDPELGIYGRTYGFSNGGISYKLKPGQPAVERALQKFKG